MNPAGGTELQLGFLQKNLPKELLEKFQICTSVPHKIPLSKDKINPDELSLSAQFDFAQEATALIEKYKNGDGEWDTLFLRLADLCCNHDDMDPVLCLKIVKKLMGYSAESMLYDEDDVIRKEAASSLRYQIIRSNDRFLSAAATAFLDEAPKSYRFLLNSL